jgi:hypothetical protein
MSLLSDTLFWFREDQYLLLLPSDTFLLPSDTFLLPGDTLLLPSDTFLLPGDTFLLPSDTFLLPGDTFFLPTDTFLFPSDTFVLPSDMFLLPSDTFLLTNDTFLLTNDTFLAGKKHIHLYQFYSIWFNSIGLAHTRSTVLEASMLTITPLTDAVTWVLKKELSKLKGTQAVILIKNVSQYKT